MNDIGILGLGVMGSSLAINLANRGYKVAAYNVTLKRIDDLLEKGNESGNIEGLYSLEKFVASLKAPRKIMLMTKAGDPVDEMIDRLLPLLDAQDIIIDGGNSYFKDTIRRQHIVEQKAVRYLGVGVSGGEEGALKGPAIMVGGDSEAYTAVQSLLQAIAAHSRYGACCNYMGQSGAGHFVKMVHNGIEYAMMQGIAEIYQLLKQVYGKDNEQLANIFHTLNQGRLNSYLIEITIDIFKHKDISGDYLVDLIVDTAGQKGTGAWTIETAIELGVPTPTLNSAVVSRNFSVFRNLRQILSADLAPVLVQSEATLPVEQIDIQKIDDALFFTSVLAFSQGLWLIRQASEFYDFNINLSEVLKTWSNGCIIRASLLDVFINSLVNNQQNFTLLQDRKLVSDLLSARISVLELVRAANLAGVAMPALSSALDYLHTFASTQLPMNLIQAQRDYFGAHTYQRTDVAGVFHTVWNTTEDTPAQQRESVGAR